MGTFLILNTSGPVQCPHSQQDVLQLRPGLQVVDRLLPRPEGRRPRSPRRALPDWQHSIHHACVSIPPPSPAPYVILGFLMFVRPFLADNYGRKLPIAIGCVIMIVGAFLQGFASNLGFFMGGRVMLGFGNSLAQISSPMLLTEICHPQHRGRLTAVYNCLWNAGAIGACPLAVPRLFESISTNWFVQSKHGSRSVQVILGMSGLGVSPASSRPHPR